MDYFGTEISCEKNKNREEQALRVIDYYHKQPRRRKWSEMREQGHGRLLRVLFRRPPDGVATRSVATWPGQFYIRRANRPPTIAVRPTGEPILLTAAPLDVVEAAVVELEPDPPFIVVGFDVLAVQLKLPLTTPLSWKVWKLEQLKLPLLCAFRPPFTVCRDGSAALDRMSTCDTGRRDRRVTYSV
jgi:hypothetical protein